MENGASQQDAHRHTWNEQELTFDSPGRPQLGSDMFCRLKQKEINLRHRRKGVSSIWIYRSLAKK